MLAGPSFGAVSHVLGFLNGLVVKNLSATHKIRHGSCRFHSWVGMIPWRGKWQPTPVFLPGKFHREISLLGYSPWGHKELDTTVRTHTCTHTHTHTHTHVSVCNHNPLSISRFLLKLHTQIAK